jgi:hypothetical protein
VNAAPTVEAVNANGTQPERKEGSPPGAGQLARVTQKDPRWNDASAREDSHPHTHSATNPRRCSELNGHGQPCKAKAVKNGRCAMHAGLSDPRAMGALGGAKSETPLRRAVRQDEALQAKAKSVLEQALDGEDEKRRFEAATKLYSIRAQGPPADTRQQELEQRRGYGTLGLHGLVEIALFGGPAETGLAKMGRGDGDILRQPEWADLIDRAAARLAKIRAETPRRSRMETRPPDMPRISDRAGPRVSVDIPRSTFDSFKRPGRLAGSRLGCPEGSGSRRPQSASRWPWRHTRPLTRPRRRRRSWVTRAARPDLAGG